jgi:hypothetical protein
VARRSDCADAHTTRHRTPLHAHCGARTHDGEHYVEPTLVAQLVSAGVNERRAARALRASNNNMEEAMQQLLAPARRHSGACVALPTCLSARSSLGAAEQ